MTREEQVAEALGEWYRRNLEGPTVDVEAFLRQHADLADELRSRLAAVAAFEQARPRSTRAASEASESDAAGGALQPRRCRGVS